VIGAFRTLIYEEELEGHMVYVSNQHTDAHLRRQLEWKVYSSGWLDGVVEAVEVGAGGHVYLTLKAGGRRLLAAAYEPTADLRRTAKLLTSGDRIRAFGGVRKATSLHPMVLNLEKFEVASPPGKGRAIRRGIYISSPRANRHLTKPLIRYGREDLRRAGEVEGWLESAPKRPLVRA
jgi:tRNA(Ile2) C34 agmatinyltransferase TiaS